MSSTIVVAEEILALFQVPGTTFIVMRFAEKHLLFKLFTHRTTTTYTPWINHTLDQPTHSFTEYIDGPQDLIEGLLCYPSRWIRGGQVC